MFQEMYGQVFGRAAAVINFHRVQRLLVAMIRRWLLVLCSMYYDDASLQELAAAMGRGQRYIRALFRIVGLPLAEPKQVDLNGSADFLGLTHGVTRSLPAGLLYPQIGAVSQGSWPHSRTHPRGFLHPSAGKQDPRGPRLPVHRDVRPDRPRRSAAASAEAVFRPQAMEPEPHAPKSAGIHPIDTMHVIQPRSVLLYKDPMLPLVIASDGCPDESAPPSIAALLFDPKDSKKIAVAAEITQDLMEVWGDSDHCIALVEQAALILGIIRFHDTIRGKSLL